MLHRWFGQTFAAMSVPAYRTLWYGSLFSVLAFMMSFTVQPVVAFNLAGTNSAVGLAQLGLGASMLLVGPFGGVIADRVSKKPLVFVGQVVVALSMVATGLLILADEITIIWLVVLSAVMGLAFAFMGPGRQAWVGELVPPNLLANAVALSQLSMNIARVGAPLLGALMLGSALFGAGGTYLFMASLFVIVLTATWVLPRTHAVPKEQRRAVRRELIAGVQHVSQNPRLRLLMGLFILTVVLGFTFQVVLPALLVRQFDHAATDIGLILTVNAVAALAISVPLAGMVSGRWAWPLMFILIGVMALGFLALAVAPSFEWALLTMVLIGPGLSGFMLLNNALVMANTSPAYFGRVMSLTMLAFGAQASLAYPWGLLADAVGEREMLAVVGVASLAVAAAGAFFWVSVVRRAAPSVIAAGPQPVSANVDRDLPRVAVMVGQKQGLDRPIVASGD